MAIDKKRCTDKYVHVKNVYIIKEVEDETLPHTKLSYPGVAAAYLHTVFEHLDEHREHFISVSLNTKNEVKAANVISIGNLNSSIVHPREVFYSAVVDLADSVLLCHNHPSGDTKPSQNDINLTRKLMEAGRIMGIDVKDHIIIGEKWDFYSMKEQNLI